MVGEGNTSVERWWTVTKWKFQSPWKNTRCSATLSTTNPTRTHQRLPADSMYYNLQLQSTVTFVNQTVVCLTNKMPVWGGGDCVSNPITGRDFSVHRHFQGGSGVQLASYSMGVFPQIQSGRSVKLTINFILIQNSKGKALFWSKQADILTTKKKYRHL
jgi:hypothetical protein